MEDIFSKRAIQTNSVTNNINNSCDNVSIFFKLDIILKQDQIFLDMVMKSDSELKSYPMLFVYTKH